MPSTGMRDAVAMPISPMNQEPAAHVGTAESVIGKEDRFEGTLRVQRGLRVLGQVDGKIEATTSVTVEEGAKVEADLTADEAIIAGEYSGKLICRQRLEIRATGLVKGEIETVRLMLHEGGFIDGALHMQKAATTTSSNGSTSGTETRSSDSLRTGISPRSTSESATESEQREEVTAGTRGSSTGSTSSTSR